VPVSEAGSAALQCGRDHAAGGDDVSEPIQRSNEGVEPSLHAAAAEPIHPQPPTPLAPKRPRNSDLPARLLTAAVLVPAVLYLVALGGLAYLLAIMVIVVLGQREFYGLIEHKGARPELRLGLAAGAALPVIAYIGSEYHTTLLMTATLLGTLVMQLRKARIHEALSSVSGTFFGVFYVGWLLSHAIVLRFFSEATAMRFGYSAESLAAATGLVPDAGIFFMIYTLTAVVFCDAGAYFAGRAFGRRKLAPTVSPGKTVEGAIGGIVAGLVGGLACKLVFDVAWPQLSRGLDWTAVALFAIVLSIVGILGDLIESLLKRDAERKDAGWLLPGMGGVLDRIDSPLLAIPVMYYMLTFYFFVQVGPR
jgi:phosphatidate cytidylyltransferase